MPKVVLELEITSTGETKITSAAGAVEHLGTTASTATGRMSALVGALASAQVAKFGVDVLLTAARTETLGVALGVIGKNAGINQGMLSGLVGSVSKLGITTQETYTNLTRMIQADLDLSKATDLARVAQNAAVIAGTNSSQAYEALLHGVTTLQPEVLRMFGITVNLEAEYRKIAQTTGRSTEALSMHEKQVIALNAVLKEGQKISGAYEESMGTAGKAMTSLARLEEEAKNALGTGLLPTMKGGIDIAADLFKGFNALPPELQRVAGSATLAAGGFAAIEGTVLALTAAGILGAGAAALFAPWIAGALAIGAVAALAQGGKGTSLLGLAKMDDLTESERTLMRYGASLDYVLRLRAEAGTASGVNAAQQKALLSGITPDDVERNRTRLGLAEQNAAEQRMTNLLKYQDKAAQIEAEISAARIEAELDPLAKIDLARQASLDKAYAAYQKDLKEFGQSEEGKAAAARLYEVRKGAVEVQAEEERWKAREKMYEEGLKLSKASAEVAMHDAAYETQLSKKTAAEIIEIVRDKEDEKYGFVVQRILNEQEAETKWRNDGIKLMDADQQETYAKVDEGATQRTKRRSDEFALVRRLYDDDVTGAINAELLKTGRWQDEGLKRLDIAAGIYVNLEMLRQRDRQNQAIVLLGQAETQHNYWLAVESGAVTAYAAIGSTSQNIAHGVTETFANVRRSLSDGFFDVLTLNFENLRKDAENFGLSMIRTFSDILAAEATKQLLGLFGVGIGSGGGLVSLGATAAGAASGVAGGSSGGGALSTASSGASLIGGAAQLYNWLTGGASTAAAVTATSGAEFLTAASGMTAAASDLGLAGAAGGSGVLAAEGGGAAASVAGAAGAAPLAAWLGPALAIGAPLMAILMNDDQSDAINAAAAAQMQAIYAAHPEYAAAIVANPFSASAWSGVNWGDSSGANWQAISEMPQPYHDQFIAEMVAAGMPAAMSDIEIPSWWQAKVPQIDAATGRINIPGQGWVDQNLWSQSSGMSDRDSGGPVWPGGSFIIGAGVRERLDIGPGGFGKVTPIDRTPASEAGGGGVVNHFSISIDARGSLADARTLVELVRNKIIPEIQTIANMTYRIGGRSGNRSLFETHG